MSLKGSVKGVAWVSDGTALLAARLVGRMAGCKREKHILALDWSPRGGKSKGSGMINALDRQCSQKHWSMLAFQGNMFLIMPLQSICNVSLSF